MLESQWLWNPQEMTRMNNHSSRPLCVRHVSTHGNCVMMSFRVQQRAPFRCVWWLCCGRTCCSWNSMLLSCTFFEKKHPSLKNVLAIFTQIKTNNTDFSFFKVTLFPKECNKTDKLHTAHGTWTKMKCKSHTERCTNTFEPDLSVC